MYVCANNILDLMVHSFIRDDPTVSLEKHSNRIYILSSYRDITTRAKNNNENIMRYNYDDNNYYSYND